MKNSVLLIGSCSIDKETGEYGTTFYEAAITDGATAETCEAMKMTITISICGESLEIYRRFLEDLDAESPHIVDMLEGRRDYFQYLGLAFSVRRFELDEGKVDAKQVSDLKTGNCLYVCYDRAGNPERVFSEYHGDSTCLSARFFRKSEPQTLTLYNYMPFVIEGDAGFMILPNGKRCGGPYTTAMPLAGMNFIVVEQSLDKQESNSYIVNVAGEKLTPDHALIEEGNLGVNGYIIFCVGVLWGFIHADSGTVSPVEYEDIEPVEIGELVHVRKNGQWGYLTEDFNFISDEEADEDDEKFDLCYWRGDDE